MTSPTIAIGITTYRDLSGEDVARTIWKALSGTDPRLTPEAVNTHEPVNVPLDICTVEAPDPWLRYWPWEAMWRRRTSIQGSGAVRHRVGRRMDSSLALHFRWDSNIDWWSLFLKLCAATEPAHGMLHLFTPEERRTLDYQAFDSAVTGELAFTSKVAADGNYVRPDSWDTEARRNWQFLPELSWGNYLGREFTSTYDPDALQLSTLSEPGDGHNALFRLTPKIEDVKKQRAEFLAARDRARACFIPGTFRVAAER